jgi:hypothetical protein
MVHYDQTSVLREVSLGGSAPEDSLSVGAEDPSPSHQLLSNKGETNEPEHEE